MKKSTAITVIILLCVAIITIIVLQKPFLKQGSNTSIDASSTKPILTPEQLARDLPWVKTAEILQYSEDQNHFYVSDQILNRHGQLRTIGAMFLPPYGPIYYYVADDESVYVLISGDGANQLDHVVILQDADPTTFSKPNSGSYVLDKSHVFFRTKVLPGVNPKTFTSFPDFPSIGDNDMGLGYGKNSTHVYYGDEMLAGADPKTFVALDNAFAKDTQHVYAYGEALQHVSPTSFSVVSGDACGLGGFIIKDDSSVYNGNANETEVTPLSHYDAATFKQTAWAPYQSDDRPDELTFSDKNGTYTELEVCGGTISP